MWDVLVNESLLSKVCFGLLFLALWCAIVYLLLLLLKLGCCFGFLLFSGEKEEGRRGAWSVSIEGF